MAYSHYPPRGGMGFRGHAGPLGLGAGDVRGGVHLANWDLVSEFPRGCGGLAYRRFSANDRIRRSQNHMAHGDDAVMSEMIPSNKEVVPAFAFSGSRKSSTCGDASSTNSGVVILGGDESSAVAGRRGAFVNGRIGRAVTEPAKDERQRDRNGNIVWFSEDYKKTNVGTRPKSDKVWLKDKATLPKLFEDSMNLSPETAAERARKEAECICERPASLVMCTVCGHRREGRARRKCPSHPGRIYSGDMERCFREECKGFALKEVRVFSVAVKLTSPKKSSLEFQFPRDSTATASKE